MYVCIYIYIHMYTHIYICIYMRVEYAFADAALISVGNGKKTKVMGG